MIGDIYGARQQARAAEEQARRNRERAFHEMQKMRASQSRGLLALPGVVGVVFVRGECLPVVRAKTNIPKVSRANGRSQVSP